MRELGDILGGQREAVEERTALFITAVGVIDREHQAIDTEHRQRGQERRQSEKAAGGDVNLICDGLTNRSLQV